MRDPKAHARVLALRRRDVAQAFREAVRQADLHRTLRLSRLLTLLNCVMGRNHQETGWFYDHTTRLWAHIPPTPDTEEATP